MVSSSFLGGLKLAADFELGHGWRVNLGVSRGLNISTLAIVRKRKRTRGHESEKAVLGLTIVLLGLLVCWLQTLRGTGHRRKDDRLYN